MTSTNLLTIDLSRSYTDERFAAFQVELNSYYATITDPPDPTMVATRIDWHATIKDGIATGRRPTKQECRAANYWVTCACGNQCSIIPRRVDMCGSVLGDGRPVDERLATLGQEFNTLIQEVANTSTDDRASGEVNRRRMWMHVLDTLIAIEERADVLIKLILLEQAE